MWHPPCWLSGDRRVAAQKLCIRKAFILPGFHAAEENVVTMTTDGLDGRNVLEVIGVLKSGKDHTQEVDMVVSNHGGSVQKR